MKIYFENQKITCMEGTPKELIEHAKLAAQMNAPMPAQKTKSPVLDFGEILARAAEIVSAKEHDIKDDFEKWKREQDAKAGKN